MRVYPLGDTAVTVEVDTVISYRAMVNVHALTMRFAQSSVEGVVELIPAFTTLTVVYKPSVVSYDDLAQHLQMLAHEMVQENQEPLLQMVQETHARCIEIPVCYEPQFAPDLAELAYYAGISTEEVIQLHTSPEYRVAMIGFTPAFPYLLGLDERLNVPRKQIPRLRVPAGSVAIGGAQTGIYPITSPGGWSIIGWTPLQLFRPHEPIPSLLLAGDRVRFYAISQAEIAAFQRNDTL
jgi:inhibitor of KinA